MSSRKWRPFCIGFNVLSLMLSWYDISHIIQQRRCRGMCKDVQWRNHREWSHSMKTSWNGNIFRVLWKLRYHWLKFLRRVAKTLVIQGPGPLWREPHSFDVRHIKRLSTVKLPMIWYAMIFMWRHCKWVNLSLHTFERKIVRDREYSFVW